MNSKLSIVVVLMFLVFNLFAQNSIKEEISLEIEAAMQEAKQEIDRAMKELDKESIEVKISTSKGNSPKLGVYLSNLNFEQMYQLHYDYNYGVYVSGVTSGGAAQNAGLARGDIIMEFDGQKVRFESHLVSLIGTKKFGESVKIKFFRMGEIYETTATFAAPKEVSDDVVITKAGKKKKKASVGHGGGSWIPIWYQPDVSEFNSFLSNMGFGNETFSEDGFLIQGGGGMGHVGKGWFIGGMGAGYSNRETVKHPWTHFKNGTMDTVMVSRIAEYSTGYCGVTLDKRFALSNKFLTSIGFMIGWGGNEFSIKQQDDNGSITNFDFENDPSGQMDEWYNYNSKIKISSDYILFQPKLSFMWRILDWLSIRSEAAYMISYSSKGWKAEQNGESVKLINAPETDMNGLTFSIGPWFGF